MYGTVCQPRISILHYLAPLPCHPVLPSFCCTGRDVVELHEDFGLLISPVWGDHTKSVDEVGFEFQGVVMIRRKEYKI